MHIPPDPFQRWPLFEAGPRRSLFCLPPLTISRSWLCRAALGRAQAAVDRVGIAKFFGRRLQRRRWARNRRGITDGMTGGRGYLARSPRVVALEIPFGAGDLPRVWRGRIAHAGFGAASIS